MSIRTTAACCGRLSMMTLLMDGGEGDAILVRVPGNDILVGGAGDDTIKVHEIDDPDQEIASLAI